MATKRRGPLGAADKYHRDQLVEKLGYAEEALRKVRFGLGQRLSCQSIYPAMIEAAELQSEVMAHAGALTSMAGAGKGVDERLEKMHAMYKASKHTFLDRCVVPREKR